MSSLHASARYLAVLLPVAFFVLLARQPADLKRSTPARATRLRLGSSNSGTTISQMRSMAEPWMDILNRITSEKNEGGHAVALNTKDAYKALLTQLRARHAERGGNGLRVLIYGTGHDTPMWIAANTGPDAVTVFLEENSEWIAIGANSSNMHAHFIQATYTTNAQDIDRPAATVPSSEDAPWAIRGHVAFDAQFVPVHMIRILNERFGPTQWDFVLVDAPVGYVYGRMQSWVMAALVTGTNSIVAGHDMHRCIEGFWFAALFPEALAEPLFDVDRTVAVRVRRPRPHSLTELASGIRVAGQPPSAELLKMIGC